MTSALLIPTLHASSDYWSVDNEDADGLLPHERAGYDGPPPPPHGGEIQAALMARGMTARPMEFPRPKTVEAPRTEGKQMATRAKVKVKDRVLGYVQGCERPVKRSELDRVLSLPSHVTAHALRTLCDEGKLIARGAARGRHYFLATSGAEPVADQLGSESAIIEAESEAYAMDAERSAPVDIEGIWNEGVATTPAAQVQADLQQRSASLTEQINALITERDRIDDAIEVIGGLA